MCALCLCEERRSLYVLSPGGFGEMPKRQWLRIDSYTSHPYFASLVSSYLPFHFASWLAPYIAACATVFPSGSVSGPPSLSEILSCRITTLTHVLKGVRDNWAMAFNECLASVCADPEDLSR